MKNEVIRSVQFSLILVLGLGVAAIAGADSDPADQIKYRKSVMKAIGGNMGGIAAVMRGKVEHKNHLPIHAAALQANSTLVKDLFPAGSDMGETEVTAAAWDKPDEFKQAVSKLEMAADGFLQAVEGGDMEQIGQALKGLGGACKNCHDNFREKKK